MRIVWDEPKRLANLAKHGMDFASLTEDFFSEALIREAKFGRFQAIGIERNGVISVVFAMLGAEGISVISMRPASKPEKKAYDDFTKDR